VFLDSFAKSLHPVVLIDESFSWLSIAVCNDLPREELLQQAIFDLDDNAGVKIAEETHWSEAVLVCDISELLVFVKADELTGISSFVELLGIVDELGQ
jgi:hypothetical protein